MPVYGRTAAGRSFLRSSREKRGKRTERPEKKIEKAGRKQKKGNEKEKSGKEDRQQAKETEHKNRKSTEQVLFQMFLYHLENTIIITGDYELCRQTGYITVSSVAPAPIAL